MSTLREILIQQARIKQGRQGVDAEVAHSKMGSRVKVPVGLSVAQGLTDYPPAYNLAELQLKAAVPLDVTFEVTTRLSAPFAYGFRSAYVLLTWGSQRGVQFSARIDPAYGWRIPLTASYVRLDFVPIQRDVPDLLDWGAGGGPDDAVWPSENPPPVEKGADPIEVAGQITPAAGGNYSQITRTHWTFSQIDSGQSVTIPRARWSTHYSLQVGTGTATFPTGSVTLRLRDYAGDFLQVMGRNGNTSLFPNWQLNEEKVIPPQCVDFRLTNSSGAIYSYAAIVHRLSL